VVTGCEQRRAAEIREENQQRTEVWRLSTDTGPNGRPSTRQAAYPAAVNQADLERAGVERGDRDQQSVRRSWTAVRRR
jgi:hypothetical protein